MATVDIPAAMAGSICEVLVAVGDAVANGQEILILESMKMEIPIESPVAGKISEILVETGQRIDEGQVLLRISD